MKKMKVNMDITRRDIIDIIVKVTNNKNMASIDPTLPLKEQGIDSLDLINIFFQISSQSNVDIPPLAQNKLKTINDLTTYLNILESS
jgi:acyl carrier protein